MKYMLELELQQYLLREFPQENARCEWKEFKNLKNYLLDYLKYVLPQRNIQEQNLRLLGNILSEMNTEGSVVLRGKLWFACK